MFGAFNWICKYAQGPVGEKRQKKIAAQAASVAGEAKGKHKAFTEEEAYMVRSMPFWVTPAVPTALVYFGLHKLRSPRTILDFFILKLLDLSEHCILCMSKGHCVEHGMIVSSKPWTLRNFIIAGSRLQVLSSCVYP